MNKKELIRRAIQAKEKAYVPYSGFQVGAAILTENNEIYHGCNIEIASYSPTICAERTAIFKAISEGHRNIKAIAVVGDADYTYPSGHNGSFHRLRQQRAHCRAAPRRPGPCRWPSGCGRCAGGSSAACCWWGK